MTADGIDRSFGAPRFDVVLRGYDRRQVDEHIARLQRVLSRMRSDLESARGRQGAVPPLMGPPAPPGARPRPSPRPRPDGLPVGAGEGRDVVGTFTERMHAILQAAEEEAAEIRGKAQLSARAEEERVGAVRSSARAEEEALRATLADLVRQRDAVLADLTRLRGQLEGLLSMPTTVITLPAEASDTSEAPRPEADPSQPLLATSDPVEPLEGAAVPDDESEDAAEPAASEPAASEPAAAEPTAAEPTASEQAPTEPAATEQAPTEQAPTELAPTGTSSTEPPAAELPVRIRFAGSSVRHPAPQRVVAAQPADDEPFDLFRPASEARRPVAPEPEADVASTTTDGSAVERTAVLRPVVRAAETADDDAEPGAAPADDAPADANSEADAAQIEQEPAARYG